MTEPIITCPKCKTEIKLTESLAAQWAEDEENSARMKHRESLN